MTRTLPFVRIMSRAMPLVLFGLGGGVAPFPLGAASSSQDLQPAPVDAGTLCVSVDIAGNRVGDLECREQRLRETVRRAQQAAAATAKIAKDAVPRNPAATGLATPAGANMRPSPLLGRTPPPPPVYSSPLTPPR